MRAFALACAAMNALSSSELAQNSEGFIPQACAASTSANTFEYVQSLPGIAIFSSDLPFHLTAKRLACGGDLFTAHANK